MMAQFARFSFLLSAFFILMVSLCSCDQDKLPEPQPSICDSVPTYDGQMKAIIDLNCAFGGCHDGSGDAPGNFTSFAGMQGRLKNGKIAERALMTQDMPEPPFTISQVHFDSLKCWIENGFPEN